MWFKDIHTHTHSIYLCDSVLHDLRYVSANFRTFPLNLLRILPPLEDVIRMLGALQTALGRKPTHWGNFYVLCILHRLILRHCFSVNTQQFSLLPIAQFCDYRVQEERTIKRPGGRDSECCMEEAGLYEMKSTLQSHALWILQLFLIINSASSLSVL